MAWHRNGLERAIAAAGLLVVGAAGAYGASRLKGHRPRPKPSPDSAPGFTARQPFGDYAVVGRSVTIARPRHELYAFWRDFGNLATFMENIVAVRPSGGNGRTVWTIKAPAGRTVDVETEIVMDKPGELIAWRSVPGSDIDTEGRVRFEDAPGPRGTRVSARIAYKPPGGEVGRIVAKLFQREPEVQARHDLKRFKMLMETGEIATSARVRSQTRAAQQAQQQRNKETA